MGLIQIRNRSERLGNIGGVRGVSNDIGADRAILAMSRADRQIDAARGDIADAAIGGAKDLLKLGIDLVKDREKKRRADAEEAERLQREQDGEDADRFVAAYQKAMSEYNNGSVDAQGNITPGAMQADISDAGEWISGNVKYRSDLAGKLRKELNLSGNAYEMAKKRLAGFDLSMQNRWQARAFEFNDAAAKSAANERLNAANVTLLNMPQLGTGTSGDGDAAYIAAWAEWNDATENALDKNHVTEPGARKAARREMAQKFVGMALQNRLSALSQGTEGMERKEIETAFSDYEDRVAEGVDGIVPSELRNANGDVLGDFLKTDLEGVDLESFKNAALKDIRREKTHALARADAREREALHKALEDIELASREAIAKGSLSSIEDAIDRMDVEAKRHPEGSRLYVAALEASKRLDAAADAAARRDDWDAILEHAADGTKWEPPKGTRMAKFHKALKASYDRQAQAYDAERMLAVDAAVQEERKANVAAFRVSMLEAAAISPGGFSARLAEGAEKGLITLDQYRKLRDEFQDVWTKRGMPQKAKALVDILKREFHPDAEYDLNDRLAVNPKTGRFEYGKNPETKKPFEGQDVKLPGYGFRMVEPEPSPFISGDFMPIMPKKFSVLKPDTLTSDEQLELLDIALDLARHDGDETHIDPLTREPLSAPRKLNAADEFQRACSMLKNIKRAEPAGDMVQKFAEALQDVESGFGRFERTKIAAVEDREAQEKSTRQALKAVKRRPFAPKMPGAAGVREESGGDEEETEE